VLRVDHRFTLSNPALVSAPSKKSFSSVSSLGTNSSRRPDEVAEQ
jgi:hypothetical protein